MYIQVLKVSTLKSELGGTKLVQAEGGGPPVQAGEHGAGGTVRHGLLLLKGTGGTVRHQLGRLVLVDPARQVSAKPGGLSCQELTHLVSM